MVVKYRYRQFIEVRDKGRIIEYDIILYLPTRVPPTHPSVIERILDIARDLEIPHYWMATKPLHIRTAGEIVEYAVEFVDPRFNDKGVYDLT